jgi:2-C-methyl-D-erythritol 4-phosphate cytidylyltransferase
LTLCCQSRQWADLIKNAEGDAVSTFAVILPAAGKSSRFRDKNYKKPFVPLAGRAVWLHVAEKFLNRDDVKQTILIISPDDREYFDFKFAGNAAILGVEVVEGGAERADSVERR